MKKEIEERILASAHYVIQRKSTIRETALVYGVSKSTVHLDLTKRLRKLNKNLYQKVAKILEKNFQEKHIRGGLATKRKFENLH